MLSARTRSATSSVIDSSRGSRSSGASSPVETAESSTILMLTSWSEQSTPAELSRASVLIRPPARSNSIRPRSVTPRLPPSPITLARTWFPSTRIASFDLSPTSAFDSVDAFTYVPMPPFHNRSTGARRMARISSGGDISSTPSSMPSAAAICGLIGIDLRSRDHTPPPGLMSSAS